MTEPHNGPRPGETWEAAHRRLARFTLRRKSDGAFWIYAAAPGDQEGFQSYAATVNHASGCCIRCMRFIVRHRKLTGVEIVERRWDPATSRHFRSGCWVEVRTITPLATPPSTPDRPASSSGTDR